MSKRSAQRGEAERSPKAGSAQQGEAERSPKAGTTQQRELERAPEARSAKRAAAERTRLACWVILAWVVAAASGCVGTVADQPYAALAERTPIRKVAVAPLGARPEAALAAAPLVSRRLAEALSSRGVEVVPPEDVARAVEGLGAGAGVLELAALVGRQFGADALLLGEITRWVEREGEALGTLVPASVGIRVVLHGAPAGERLWEGEFDRTQQALLENVLLTPGYPGGGTRWLRAEEFAQFAADQIAAALPLVP